MRREISYLQATMYYFVYFINLRILATLITRFFYDFPKIYGHFPKISDDFQNVVRCSYECFLTFSELFQRFPKIAEDGPKMFRLNIDLFWLIHH